MTAKVTTLQAPQQMLSPARTRTGGPPPEKPRELSEKQMRRWLEQLKKETPYIRAWSLVGGVNYFHNPSGFTEDQTLQKDWQELFKATLNELPYKEAQHFKKMMNFGPTVYGIEINILVTSLYFLALPMGLILKIPNILAVCCFAMVIGYGSLRTQYIDRVAQTEEGNFSPLERFWSRYASESLKRLK